MSIKNDDKYNSKKLDKYGNESLETNKKKVLFIISLIAAIIIENSIILYVPISERFNYTTLISLFNSLLAAELSILLVINIALKQKFLDYHLKIYIVLAIGLILWLCANIQWIIYGVEDIATRDIPSLADFFWLSAYPFFGYLLYSTFRRFYKKYFNKKIFLMIIGCGILFATYIFYIITSLSEFLNNTAFISLLVTYAILNTILIIPAILICSVLKKENELSILHMYVSLSLLSFIIVDSFFVIIFLSDLVEMKWITTLLIDSHYLILSAGLLWSLEFLYPIRYRISFNSGFYKLKKNEENIA